MSQNEDAICNHGSHEPHDRPKWHGHHQDEHGTAYQTIPISLPLPLWASIMLSGAEDEHLSTRVERLLAEAMTTRRLAALKLLATRDRFSEDSWT